MTLFFGTDQKEKYATDGGRNNNVNLENLKSVM